MKTVGEIGRESDGIARAGAAQPHPAGLYEPFLLSLVPEHCDRVLDVGCGTGRFTQQLAGRARRVTALDVSGEMIRIARERNAAPNVQFIQGDALEVAEELGGFNCVVTLAAFHHLPVQKGATILTRAVAPGGTLIPHDLWRVDSVADRAVDAVRLPYKAFRLLQLGAPLVYSSEERAAWREHARDDVHLTKREVRALSDRFFPGAVLHEHFLWRYTLVWQKVPPIG